MHGGFGPASDARRLHPSMAGTTDPSRRRSPSPRSRSPSPTKRPRCDDGWPDSACGWPPSPLKLPAEYRHADPCSLPPSPWREEERRPCPPPPPASEFMVDSYPPFEPDESDHERCREQWQGYAELALRRHNKNKGNMVKYSLVELVDGHLFFEDGFEMQLHLNLYVHAKNGPKKHGPNELVFAELRHVGLRRHAMMLTSWQLLDGNQQFPGRCNHQERGNFFHCSEEARDVRHCYACPEKIMHPEGWKYKAGHFIDHIYYCSD